MDTDPKTNSLDGCLDYHTIPSIAEGDGSAPIKILPKHIPQTLTVDTLVELYQFGSWDDNPVWAVSDKDGNTPSYDQIRISSEEEEVEVEVESVDICEDGASGGASGTDDNFHNSWYILAKTQQDVLPNRKEQQQWIRETALGSSSNNSGIDSPVTWNMRAKGGSSGVWGALNAGYPIHPPATPTKQTPPPMPTPSFAPATSGGSSIGTKVKVGDSLKNVFQFKKGKLEVVAPDDDCSDYDTDEFESKAVLTYDPDTGKMVWECTEPSEGGEDVCCPVLIYENKIVTGVDAYGNYILGDTVSVSRMDYYDYST